MLPLPLHMPDPRSETWGHAARVQEVLHGTGAPDSPAAPAPWQRLAPAPPHPPPVPQQGLKQ